jgi:hypothetical protein
MSRTLTILFPNGSSEYWHTDLAFEVGSVLPRNGKTWVVTSAGNLNNAGQYTVVTVREFDPAAAE